MTVIAVVDTETTGEDPEAGAELVEAAVVLLDIGTGQQGCWSSLVRPVGPIPPAMSAVHHITAEVLAASEPIEREQARATILGLCAGVDAIAAHHAEFDRRHLPELADKPWICTCRCAKHLWPTAPAYGLQVLRYWRGLQVARLNGLAPHRALYDTLCAAALLADQWQAIEPPADPLQVLRELTDRMPLQRVCRFGKHRGKPWGEVPKDYLQWIANKHRQGDEFDPEVVATVQHYLGELPL